MAKDLFSNDAASYARFRPEYPPALFGWLAGLVPATNMALDCATGNGQVASALSGYFTTVIATDISEAQLENAVRHPNIQYRTAPAEEKVAEENSVDLLTVAQAVHWFDFPRFFESARWMLRQQGIIALIGYSLVSVDAETDEIIRRLYTEILGPYWDPERRFIDEKYQTIPFPFTEIASPAFSMQLEWTLTGLTGYLGTWSALGHYIRANGHNPLDDLQPALAKAWKGSSAKQVSFPLLLRVGRK